MKIIFSKKAVTLMELIISLLLVSIVVLGIFSINVVLSNSTQDYGQRYLVRSETQATLNHILNDAALAVGSASYVGTPSELDQGIVTGLTVATGVTNFCIHQKPASGDTWMCYTFDNSSSGTAHDICSCSETYNASDVTGNRGLTGAALANCCGITNSFLGTAHAVTPTFTNTGGKVLFSITIQNCLNNAAATCSSTGTSTDQIYNPEVQVSGSVSPSQEGV